MVPSPPRYIKTDPHLPTGAVPIPPVANTHGVMGIKRSAVGRKCLSWALNPLVLNSFSLSYLSIGIVPYCLDTRGVSPMYLLYSAHGAQ